MTLPIGDDTIAAIATPPGRGGVGIIRVSGPGAFAIAEAMTGASPTPRTAALVILRDQTGEAIDQGFLLRFPGPHSFTGEDVVEFHCHGGPVLLATVLRHCIDRGARAAEPGEFSRRAFLNDKIDLLQAEAIADLIASDTEAAARSASRSLTGEFSRRVDTILEDLIRLRVFVEAAIDFPEEEIDFIAESDVLERLDTLERTVDGLLGAARRGKRLREGMKLVLAGSPNVGKSSLLNALAEADTAIVTDIPGTTRDVLREHIEIDGLPLHIVDTAGLREADNAVEQEGIRRAERELASADHVLLVSDAQADGSRNPLTYVERFRACLPEGVPVTLLRNKIDLTDDTPGLDPEPAPGLQAVIGLSAKKGEGIEILRQHLLACAGLDGPEVSDFSARERHVRALERCRDHLEAGRGQLRHHGAAELIAEDLRYAQDALGEITGRFHNDELLGEIFGSFCIGK